MTQIAIGRLLRANTSGCVVGCRVSQLGTPSFGSLVRIPIQSGYQVFGLIHDIRIDDDGLVRQLVTADGIEEAVIQDNRLNRNVPVELSVLLVGYEEKGRIFHLLPPRPPLSLDSIFLCDNEELVHFTQTGHFGYFRHILRAVDIPTGDLLAAHLREAQVAQSQQGHSEWLSEATRELITLLRDDYPALMGVLSAIGEAG